MRNKIIGKKEDYRKLMRKLYVYIAIAVVFAVFSVVILRQLVRGVAGDGIVKFLMKAFRFQHEEAMRIYQNTIRNNLSLIIMMTIILCFFFLCHLIMSSFMGYFDEVNVGIDSLINDDDKKIILSTEMAFMEKKLNTLKNTLDAREQEAKEAEQRKNDLVMYLAHDIKTPLTSIIGYLSLLDEAPNMPVDQKAKYVNITLEKAYRLESLINEFFEITRYNLNTTTLYKKNIDIYYMLVQMTDELYPLLISKEKKVTVVGDENISIYGDGDKLARVFNNILKNAIAYSEDGSTIEIKVECIKDKVVIVFRNTGNIQKEKLDTIFDKFYRLDEARSSDSGGAGLGLSIAKEIVLLHEGEIFADSDGDYITFTVELPVDS